MSQMLWYIFLFLFIAAVCLLIIYLEQTKNTEFPSVCCKQSAWNQSLLDSCKHILESPYKPTLWAYNSHVQTFFALLWPPGERRKKREFLEMNDGGIVGLDWVKVDQIGLKVKLARDSPVVVILTAPFMDYYCLPSFTDAALHKGFRPVVFHKRGSSWIPMTTGKLEGFGDPLDFTEVLEYVHYLYPFSSIFALGISVGCSTILKYLTSIDKGQQSSHLVTGAVCISPGCNVAGNYLNDGIKEPYNRFITYKLKSILNYTPLLDCVNDLKISEITSLKDFDLHFMTKAAGFRSLLEYWQANDPIKDLQDNISNVDIPLLIINSKDDPFYSGDEEDQTNCLCESCKTVMVVETRCGGHAGFLEGIYPDSWAARLTFEYLMTAEFMKDNGIRH